jgi:hypothetical protein
VGKEAEALVAAVLKLLQENDRVNWPALAEQRERGGENFAASPANIESNDASSRYDVTVKEENGDERGGDESRSYRRLLALLRAQEDFRQNGIMPSRFPHRMLAMNVKRGAEHKFNPTGWKRKKRSTSDFADPAFPSSSSSASSSFSSFSPASSVVNPALARYYASLHNLFQHIRQRYDGEGRNLPNDVAEFAEPLPPGSESFTESAEPADVTYRKRNSMGRLILRRQWPQQPKRKPAFNPTGW